MKAIVQDEYGAPEDVLKLQEIDKPPVGDGEALVRVHAAPISGDNWHLMRGLPYVARFVTGLRKPRNRVPGLELAGTVEAVGKDVTTLQPATRYSAGATGPLPSTHRCPRASSC